MTLRRGVMMVGVTLAGAALLAGCAASPAVGVAVAGAQMVSLTSTKKTIGDHVVSSATGEDCSIVSFTETGHYCPEQIKVDRSRLYCYRTLADVECHNIPDPYKNGNVSLASPPPDRKPAAKAKGWFE